MPDIRNVLEVIRQAANDWLQNIAHRGDDWVVLSSIAGHDGAISEHIDDRVVMTLYNITRENVISTHVPARAGHDGYALVKPPLHINLHIMLMANFSDRRYPEGLAAISRIIAFFQQNPCFTQQSFPALTSVDKLTLDMENLSPVDISYAMGILGTKYLPSAFYRLRLLPFDGNAMQARTYGVMAPPDAHAGPA